MGESFYLFLLTGGIILLKVAWVATDPMAVRKDNALMLAKTSLIEAIIWAAQLVQIVLFPLPRTPFDPLLITGGLLFYIIGMILTIWARIAMNQSWGYPGHIPKSLVTHGPFRLSRHPIYLGWLFIYYGFGMIFRTPLVILRLPLTIYFYKSAIAEEAKLEKRFGKEYTQYKQQTKRFFFF